MQSQRFNQSSKRKKSTAPTAQELTAIPFYEELQQQGFHDAPAHINPYKRIENHKNCLSVRICSYEYTIFVLKKMVFNEHLLFNRAIDKV